MAANDLTLGQLFGADDACYATPFELWCEQQGVRPDHPGAFEVFEAARERVERESHQLAG